MKFFQFAMYSSNRTSSKPKSKLPLSNETTMLLEVTPAQLESLGIAAGNLVLHGRASVAPAKGAARRARKLQVMGFTTSPKGPPKSDPQPPTTHGISHAELLSAQVMAERMQCTRANVYDQEKRGNLFSVVPPGRQNGRLFPSFQLEPTLERGLLRRLIATYTDRQVPLNLLWSFLQAAHQELGGLSGVELLAPPIGNRPEPSARARAIWALPDAERAELVLDVALEDLSHAFI